MDCTLSHGSVKFSKLSSYVISSYVSEIITTFSRALDELYEPDDVLGNFGKRVRGTAHDVNDTSVGPAVIAETNIAVSITIHPILSQC